MVVDGTIKQKNMNCKYCDNKLANEAKFCNKCGKSIEVVKPKVNIEKLKKNLKNTGNSVYAIGWITIIINLSIYLWSILDKNFVEYGLPASDLSGAFLAVVTASVFVILGNRIKELVDKNIKLYLQILLGLSLLLFVWIIFTGGRVGILLFFVVIYLISSSVQISKAMKSEEFTATLISPKYKLDKKGWIIFAIVSIVIFFVTLGIDISMVNYSTKEASQQKVEDYFTDSTSWKSFVSTSGFSVLFPKYPTLETENIPIPNSNSIMQLDNYASETLDGTAYLIMVSTPLGISSNKPLTNFDGPLNGMLASDPTNKLISSYKTTFNGRSALDYLIKNEGSGYFIKGKLILKGATMYTLMVAYESKNYNENDYDKFINSFVLQ